ncbi:epididymal-specific lipocalin-12 isoform X2 [Monodelphis domestica]|uniref:epididymal-specific lipocalin-12 isoform X2 n=1 Tax=Monodelphis domestica TaxID=13616 RepID=UPI0024E1B260|nr:epididymal-specific lipocalin-12 isoform X2 [Monodelphis domestica]
MALSPMMTGVILLGSLRSQLRKSDLPIVPRLSNIPLQMNFIAEQFQGKWYVVGVAGNAFTSEEQGRFKMYTTAYDLQKDNSYIVTSTILRDNLCDRFVRTFVQKDRPGQFTLGNLKSYGLQDYFIRVVKTDYNNYAVVYFKKTVNNVDYFKITLYGRRDNLQPELKKDFTNFVKSLGLTDENIVFPVKINKCIYEA